MSLKLRIDLPFDQGIMFSGFLPEAESDWLHLVLREGKYRVSMYLSDRSKQLSNITDVPEDPMELENHMTLFASSLAVEIEARQVDRDVVNALEAAKPTEKTEAFAREIYEVVLEVHNGLVSYFRNIANEYWLKPLDPDPPNFRQFVRHRWGLSWLDSADEWQRFPFTRTSTGLLTARMLEWGVDRDRWREVGPFIERGARAAMRDVLISNSLEHLSERNGRLAVVEAVIALESAVKVLLPEIVLRRLRLEEIEGMRLHQLLDSLVRKAGLWPVTEVGVELIWTEAGLTREDIDTVRDAVNVRHQVIHDPRREVDISDAHEYVSGVRRLIDALERWNTKAAGRSLSNEC